MYEVLGLSCITTITSKNGTTYNLVHLYLEDKASENNVQYGIATKELTIFDTNKVIFNSALSLKEGDKVLIMYNDRGRLEQILNVADMVFGN